MIKSLIISYLSLMAPGANAQPHPVPDGPRPAVAPVSWELRFRFDDPQRLSVVVPGESKPVVYWYMLYQVENTSNREVDYYPRFDLVTDTLQVIGSEQRVSPEAFQAIQRRVQDPLLLTPEKAIGRLLAGKDQARKSVAVWRDFDPKAKGFSVFVTGLSGETMRLRNPAFDAAQPAGEDNPRYFVLRKTLEIPYKLRSGESTRASAAPERIEDKMRWTMR